MELNPNNVKRLKELIIFTILLFLGIQNVHIIIKLGGWILELLYPFILGSCIAFIINVPMRALERKLKLRRGVSIFLTMTLVFSVVLVVFFLIVPQVGNTFVMLSEGIPGLVTKVEKWMVSFFGRNPELFDSITALDIDWENILQSVFSFFRTGVGSIINSTLSAAVSLVSSLTSFFMSLIFSVYVLSQKERLGSQVSRILYAYLPENGAKRVISISSLASKTFSNFLSGQCIEAVILGLMFFVTMSIFRFPYALMISVLIAFTALIPIFGAFIGSIIGTFLILMVNPVQAFWFIIMFNVLQQVEGNLIYPRVVGGSVGLSPMWVLVAVIVGGNTMGIVGMLVFIPMFSVFYTLLRESVANRLRAKKAVCPEKGLGDERLEHARPVPDNGFPPSGQQGEFKGTAGLGTQAVQGEKKQKKGRKKSKGD